MAWRLAKHVVSVGNGESLIAQLALPHIEGLVIVPKFIQIDWDRPVTTGVRMGITHDNSFPAISPDIGFAEDPSVWFYYHWESGEQSLVRFDLRGYDFELAGPQGLIWQDDGHGSGTFSVLWMWYDVKRVSLAEWIQIANATSFGH